MNTTFVRLSSRSSDMIVRCSPYAEIVYWGKPLLDYSPAMMEAAWTAIYR